MKELKAYRVTVGTTSPDTTYGTGKKIYRECKDCTIIFITHDPREIYDEFPLAESITEIGLGYIGNVAFPGEDSPIGIGPFTPVQALLIEGYACPECHGPVELRSSHRSGKKKEEWFVCVSYCSARNLELFIDGAPLPVWLKANQEDKGND